MIRRRWESLNDEKLVALCNQGQSEDAAAAFEVLYLRHKDYVVRVAQRYVPEPDAALDVLQDTFRYLLGRFPPSGPGLTLSARLTTLLYPVAKNLAIDLCRRARRFTPAGDVDPDRLPASDVPAGCNVDPLLHGLSEERREVVLLRFVDDLSLQEIADVLQIPLGTVKSRLHLALRQLRESPEARAFLDA